MYWLQHHLQKLLTPFSLHSMPQPCSAQGKAQEKFGFLLEDDAESSVVEVKKKEKRREDKSGADKKDRHIRKRDYDSKEWESDEEEKEKARKRRREDEDVEREDDMELDIPGGEDVSKEQERVRDLEERDAFAERVRDRDREKTKKIVEDRSAKNPGAAEAAQRRLMADDGDLRNQAMPSLRQHSRQEYLTKREIQQIELLRKEIADDESLFAGMKISKRERADLDRKKQLLQLVEERLKINDKYDGYQLPEDYITEQGKIDKKKKESVLYKRYEDAKPKDDQFTTDIDQWEAAQTQNSTFKTGAMDKPDLVEEYEYVFDESQTIKFVMDQTMGGENQMSAADKLLQATIDEAERRGISNYG
ncbi:hypothetical protein FIBSPDRAFT_16775 [Athelia psychrophila]|uniref:Uncharacterized protein n=1 Tax=Athelia psychrophila TaxID=1759441 RepID=A0A166U8H9_9AGAM|nr:hypothetical protein FIBSPDRAFT_16775 [Fibularhizoctonia sp. CBS 109695]